MDDANAQPECKRPENKEISKTKSGSDSDSDGSGVILDETSSDDDDLRKLGLHPMTRQEKRRYYEQLVESDGFDVEDFSSCFACGLIIPIPFLDDDEKHERFKTYSNLAIDHYNTGTEDEAKKIIELVRVVKVNWRGTYRFDYFITFEAKSKDKDAADAQTKTFQALVTKTYPCVEPDCDPELPGPLIFVQYCRLKPTH